MTDFGNINIVYEDALSMAIIERLLGFAKIPLVIHLRLGGKGCGYIRSRIKHFHQAARHQPFFILLDSDKETCAYNLLTSLVPSTFRNPNCLFRIAVREIEAWLLADSKGTSKFLGISERLVPKNPESLIDPKNHLITLARQSKKRQFVAGIIPDSRTSAAVGPEYNQILSVFIKNDWDVRAASKRSESLRRALSAIETFNP
jgi:hypothetical protein